MIEGERNTASLFLSGYEPYLLPSIFCRKPKKTEEKKGAVKAEDISEGINGIVPAISALTKWG